MDQARTYAPNQRPCCFVDTGHWLGYITAGGSSNSEGGHFADISYYDIPSDTWTKIGDLPEALNTPVCDMYDGWLYCETGHPRARFSYKIQIEVAN